MQIITNGDTRPLIFMMIQSADHISGLTGATVTVTISKNGGSFASPSGSVTEIANGWYKFTPSGSDTTTNGMMALHATATAGDPTDIACQVVAVDVYSTGFGLSNVSSNVVQWNGTAVSTIPPDSVFIRSGTAQGGGASTITLDSGASSTNNLYQNEVIFIRSGTGAGQSAAIASYVGSTKVATIYGTWAVNPDNTSVFTIGAAGRASGIDVAYELGLLL